MSENPAPEPFQNIDSALAAYAAPQNLGMPASPPTGLSLLANIINYRNTVKAFKVGDTMIHGFGKVINVQGVTITLEERTID